MNGRSDTLNLATAVLLPIDMQLAFDHPPWPRRWNGSVDRNGQRLLNAWRAAAKPIIHVRHDSIELGSTLRPEKPGHAYRPGFEPGVSEAVVPKSVNSAFIGTDLDLRLRRAGMDTVVIFGISTDMCVSTTVRVGANLGYRTILVADACDCFDLTDETGAVIPAETIHRAHVATLGFEFAQVASVDRILEALALSAVNPRDSCAVAHA